MTLDFIFVHDYPAKYRLVLRQNMIELAMGIAGISSYQIRETEESSLVSRTLAESPFPEGAILYVHGNLQTQYQNVGLVREFTATRPDLQFVLQLDPVQSHEWHFRSKEDYEYVRSLPQERHASQHVIWTHDLKFFAPERDEDYWLATYLQELKQLRGL